MKTEKTKMKKSQQNEQSEQNDTALREQIASEESRYWTEKNERINANAQERARARIRARILRRHRSD